jgi:hypothetical protein
MSLLKQSTARNKMIFMVDETDHVTGLAGLTLTITASKDGAAFASISPTVTDRGNGWYNIALTSSHTDTLGDLALHVTSTGADPLDLQYDVVKYLNGDELTTAMADSVAAPGAIPSPAQSLLMLHRRIAGATGTSGTTATGYKEDNTTPFATWTLTLVGASDVSAFVRTT